LNAERLQQSDFVEKFNLSRTRANKREQRDGAQGQNRTADTWIFNPNSPYLYQCFRTINVGKPRIERQSISDGLENFLILPAGIVSGVRSLWMVANRTLLVRCIR
jgi:hypothetical protein